MARPNRDVISRERDVDLGQAEQVMAALREARSRVERAHYTTTDVPLRKAYERTLDAIDDQAGEVASAYAERQESEAAA